MKGPAKAFWIHGWMCATHPCEVLFCIITLLLTLLSFIEWSKDPSPKNIHPDYLGIDVLFMTCVRLGALLYTYHQFQNLCYIGSKYLFGIAGLFVVFSCVFYCCTVLKLLDSNISDLKDAVFFFLLLVDLNKARYLAQFAIASSSYHEVQENIAEGLSLLGPSLTLDTIAEALLIGAGTLTGVRRVEQMCGFAVISILVNYILLITFYPACLSLILELTHRCSPSEPPWQPMREAKKLEDTKSNPILQRVKIIMSAGLFLVHGITRWSINPRTHCLSAVGIGSLDDTDISSEPPTIVRWLNAGLDHAVVMIIVVVLFVKYTFFENFWPSEEQMQNILKERAQASSASSRKESALSTPIRETRSSQTDNFFDFTSLQKDEENPFSGRSVNECLEIWRTQENCSVLNDAEVISLLNSGKVSHRLLEKKLRDPERSVALRRLYISSKLTNMHAIDNLPYLNYDYSKVQGVCCENVIGYMQIPIGVAGPLRIEGTDYMVPLATTEGALVASTSRGCKALSESPEGVKSRCFKDAMTRGPVVQLPTAVQAVEVYEWIMKDQHKPDSVLVKAFNATSHYAKLKHIDLFIVARMLYIRFEAATGDAMGMNMVTKGTDAAISILKTKFPEVEVISISGNVCTDKKHSAANWILGRGKSIVCEAFVPSAIVKSVLKTTTTKLVEANIKKNLVGSSVAGSIGGNNAHAANIIAAIFIACGQDPAQVVESSSCITFMEKYSEDDLYISVTMPCIEVGTVGGGTTLAPQAACLEMLGVRGSSSVVSGDHAKHLATIAAATVMAGELSLMASLTEQTLVQSHLSLNRPDTSRPAS